MPESYRKRGLFRPNPEVAQEIARLNAVADCQRIVHLLTAYEFAWDIERALELALFYTYGSAPISQLLDKTGEFREHGQKRYDDTKLLITHFMSGGWDGDEGRRALARINRTHGHYRIDQDDFIFTLWTFIAFPLRWTERWSPRAMSAHEKAAWFNFWLEIGRRMNIAGLPPTPAAYDLWISDYKQRTFIPSDASARVAQATVRIIENWLPKPLRRLAVPVIYSLFDDDPLFLAAIRAPTPPAYLRPLADRALRAMAQLRRHVVLGAYPARIDSSPTRTYGKADPAIEALAPQRILGAEKR